jgi:hypothetical protein
LSNNIRIKRSVQAKFQSDISYLSSQILEGRGAETSSLKENLSTITGFVKAEITGNHPNAETRNNPDEIAIDEVDSDNELSDEKDPEMVPAPLSINGPDVRLGAKDRFKLKRNQ